MYNANVHCDFKVMYFLLSLQFKFQLKKNIKYVIVIKI